MKLIPSEKIELKTELSIQEVRKILVEYIRPKKGPTFGFKNQKENKLFEGTFERDEFKIQRISKGRNSFLPQIKGQIQSDFKRTILIADLKVHNFSIVFMIFWLTFIGFAFVMGIVGIIKQDTNPILLIFPLIMIAFGIGLVHFGFNKEKENSINDLKRIINGQVKEKTFANSN
ncbi:hypothetical protein OOZ15_09665 [Galbibacter sp. EGI 63066]|uniref:hypothetical protein n=1 Tax=Galbibacter sp. EGI 63066 TaxID=2993559 RepID=UPI0022492B04|nr:hypothetical protein [Galbibacter sp. EGI 63066]MCX2680204.1 hypothetical protein [Galbibacter sp. EGI 63066]